MQHKHKNISIFIPHLGCPNDCSFCNQRTISGQENAPSAEDVAGILERAVKEIPEPDKADTEIAFFGGSFTAIDRCYMLSLLETAHKYLGVGGFYGIRISTRPDCIDDEILLVLKRYGVTAIELGAQSMNDAVLKKNNRGHTAYDVMAASNLIKRHGFSLGLQMMIGLYGDDEQGAYHTAEKIVLLRPDTVRIYPTVVLRGTRLAQLMTSGEYGIMPVENAVKICADLLLLFKRNNIAVIRLGLHASSEVEGEMIGGIYHPAFGELCEGELYFKLALEKLSDLGVISARQTDVTIFVSERCISKMIGQKRVNIERFKSIGVNVTVKGLCTLGEYEIEIA